MRGVGETAAWPHTRKYTRVRYGARITFKSSHQDHKIAIARDLSEGGTFIAAGTSLSLGTNVVLYLKLRLNRKTPSLCIVSGTVVRLAEQKREVTGYGIKFDPNLSKNSTKMLKEFVALRRAEV